MDTDAEIPATDAEQASVLPEVEIFCYLLIIMFHVDNSMIAEVRPSAPPPPPLTPMFVSSSAPLVLTCASPSPPP